MREILFKGKRVDNGDWVYGYLRKIPCCIQVGSLIKPWYIEAPPQDPDDNGGLYNIIPETVGQYTGLTDKNGNKIFEGDYLGDWCCDENDNEVFGIYGVVTYSQNDGAYRLLGEGGFINDWSLEDEAQAESWKCLEIAGNIHDNPELIKEREKE